MLPSAWVQLAELPLTPNGKVDRKTLQARPVETAAWAQREYVGPRNPTEELLSAIWAAVLQVERVGIHDNFFELGGDSILSIRVVARAHREGLRLRPDQLFQYRTIAELAAQVEAASVLAAEQGVITGAVPLTPIQQWFFESELVDAHHWNQALLLVVERELTAEMLATLVAGLQWQHDALRLRFARQDGEWRQELVAPGSVPSHWLDLSELAAAEQEAEIAAVADATQASLDLEAGPVWRVVGMELGAARTKRVLLVVHHLVVDGVSWRILLEDLERGYEQLRRGSVLELGAKSSSYKDWAESLVKQSESRDWEAELRQWTELAGGGGARLLEADAELQNEAGSAGVVEVALGVAATGQLLREVPEVYHTQITEVLLTALVEAHWRWRGASALKVAVEWHGREEAVAGVELTRTVGWFTSLWPVVLEREAGSEEKVIGERLKRVKERLRAVKESGIWYGMMRYLHPSASVREQFRQLGEAEISFNYLDQLDQLTTKGLRVISLRHNSLHRAKHVLDITAEIKEDELLVRWTYNKNIYTHEIIQQLADYYLEALRALINHCVSPESGGYTPSDFPQAGLNQQELDDLVSELSATLTN